MLETKNNYKDVLRKELIQKRLNYPNQHDDTQKAYNLFSSLNLIKPNDIISGYAPIRGEMDCLYFLERLSQQSIMCVLPAMTPLSKILKFRPWFPEQKMVLGKFEIPVSDCDDLDVSPTVMIVPVVGFNAECDRLGYGGGFFDLTIKELTPRLTIGLAYDFQELDKFMPSSHDQALSYIITPTRIIQRP